MPHIQICGYPPAKAEELAETVRFAIRQLGLAADVVVAIVPMEVRACDSGCHSPYIRICSTNPDEIGRIIRELKEGGLGEDVEYLVLGGFIPAKEMGKIF